MSAYMLTSGSRVRLSHLLSEHFDLEGFRSFVLKFGGQDELDGLSSTTGKESLVASFVARLEKRGAVDDEFFVAWRECVGSSRKPEVLGFRDELGMRTTVTSTKDLGGSPQVVGDPDIVRLVCKVSAPSFTKSTKAIELPGGCLVQVSTKERNGDGSFAVAEAMSFVPGVRLAANPDGQTWRFVMEGEA